MGPAAPSALIACAALTPRRTDVFRRKRAGERRKKRRRHLVAALNIVVIWSPGLHPASQTLMKRWQPAPRCLCHVRTCAPSSSRRGDFHSGGVMNEAACALAG